MPTYEYECTSCGHVFEKFHGISAPPPKRCPKCRCKVNRRVSMGSGLLFKGTGFYITDYRSDGYKKASKADQGGTPAAATPDKSGKPKKTSSTSSKTTPS